MDGGDREEQHRAWMYVSIGVSSLRQRRPISSGCRQYDNGVPLAADAALRLFQGVFNAGCTHFDTGTVPLSLYGFPLSVHAAAEVYHSGPFGKPPGKDAVFNESQLGAFFATIPRGSFTVRGSSLCITIHPA